MSKINKKISCFNSYFHKISLSLYPQKKEHTVQMYSVLSK